MKNQNTKKTQVKPKKLNPASVKRLIICLVSALLLVGVFMGVLVSVNAYRNSGKGIRDVVVLKSEHFTLTLPMYTYYFRSMGKGADADLVAMALSEQMALYEAALSDKETLGKDRLALLDAQIEELKRGAKKEGQSIDEFLSLQYGRGIKLEDIRSLLEMTALAAQKDQTMWNAITVAQGDIENYCKENAEEFLYCDYLSHVFTVPLNSKMTEAEKEQMVSLYEDYAKRLSECESAEAFIELVISYEEGFAKEEDADAVLTDVDKEEIRTSLIFERSSYSEFLNSDAVVKDLNTWLYDGARKVGDCKVLPYKNLDKSVATVGVYYITRPLYTNTDPTHTVYDISLSFDRYTKAAAKANAEKAKDAYQKNPTDATLQSLAVQYGGGLSENVAHTNKLDKELYTWLSQVRQTGDVMVYEGSDGWHMICYVEEGMAECYAQAKNTLRGQAYAAEMDHYRKAHKVTVNPQNYTDLPELAYGWLIF